MLYFSRGLSKWKCIGVEMMHKPCKPHEHLGLAGMRGGSLTQALAFRHEGIRKAQHEFLDRLREALNENE